MSWLCMAVPLELINVCVKYLGIFPIFERPVQYYLTHHAKVVEPFVVLYQTALKLVEARKSGTAKQAKVCR